MQEIIKNLEALFGQGLLDASDNYQAAKNGAEVKENSTTDSGAKYSLREFSDGTRFVDVQMEANVFENMTVSEMNKVAKAILMEKFSGKVIGIDNRVYVNGSSINEYLHPSKSIDLSTRKAKLTASGEIDNLLDAGKALPNKPDGEDGHVHPGVIDFSYFKTLFKVGNEYFEGIVNVENIKRGKLLKDITHIKNITRDIVSSYGKNPKSNFLRDASMDIVRNESEIVKEKFHLRESAEETKNLVALHNLTEDKLAKSLELGGFPMPSIAITKSDIPHTNFGDITLVFGKETIDPKASKKNTVYSADAWTPTFPQVEYEANRDVSAKISKKHSKIAKQYGYEFARPLYSSANYVEDELNRHGGEQGIVEHFASDTDMMQVFLADTGKTPVENVMSETVTRISDDKIAEYDFLISNLGKDVIGELTTKAGQSPLEARKAWLANYGEDLKEAFRQYLIADGMAETTANEAVKDMKPGSLIHEAIAARNYMRNGAETRKTSIDYSATRNAIKEAVNAEEYKAWLQDLYSGVEKDKGVYNQKDRYTASGNLKSFKQTHLPYTLDGIVKAMASQNGGNTKNVSGFNGVKTLRAGTAERFSSIADMHKREGRLQHLTQEQADQISDELQNRTYELIDRVDKANSQKGDSNSLIRFDTIGEILMEIAESGSYNVSDIQSVFSKYSRSIGDDLAIEVKQLLFDISQMPVNIFEAKPERAVAFSEIKAAVLPNGTSQEVVNGLKQNGVPVMFYEQGNNEQRLERVNSVANAKFHMRGDPNVERVNRVLEKENAKLKEDVADLKAMLKLQRQVTNGTKFTKSSVEAAAKMLKKNMDAMGSTKELSGLLNTFYEYIASAKELSWEDVVEQAKRRNSGF